MYLVRRGYSECNYKANHGEEHVSRFIWSLYVYVFCRSVRGIYGWPRFLIQLGAYVHMCMCVCASVLYFVLFFGVARCLLVGRSTFQGVLNTNILFFKINFNQYLFLHIRLCLLGVLFPFSSSECNSVCTAQVLCVLYAPPILSEV